MIASVSPEADRELTEGALFYAREGNAEVALALIAEYERVLMQPTRKKPRAADAGRRGAHNERVWAGA
jgi:hypothetical protein